MTTHMTKTWFDGKNIITQEIPEAEIYKREWVGLTEDERDDAFDESMKVRPKEASNAETRRLFARAIEAKLKEKNT